MELHANAALTVQQRKEVRRLHQQEKVPIRELAKRFHVNPTTIQRWAKRESPLDRSATPLAPRSTITPEYQAAVVAYRGEHPKHGPVRIAAELLGQFPQAHRGTVLKILQDQKLTRPAARKPPERKPLPVGRHRVQIDIQQLPAIEGSKGFEHKLSAIHMRTRVKYSEIHRTCTSETVVGFLRRALDALPPFF